MIRKFLFMRYSHLERRNVPVCVEAMNYDHAVTRLLAEEPGFKWSDWDYIEELAPEHFLGKLGRTIKYTDPH